MRNQPLYILPDPYRRLPGLPIDALTLSEQLDISRKTALRICTGHRRLKKCEVRLLQVLNFGLIPDPDFLRYRLSFYAGALYCHESGLTINAGELATLYIWKTQHQRLIDDLARAQARITELENLLTPPATNVIRFADWRK